MHNSTSFFPSSRHFTSTLDTTPKIVFRLCIFHIATAIYSYAQREQKKFMALKKKEINKVLEAERQKNKFNVFTSSANFVIRENIRFQGVTVTTYSVVKEDIHFRISLQ